MPDLDELTQLPGIKALPSPLDAPTAAVFLDIDAFNRVNYDHGHLAGDDLLRQLGAWLAAEATRLEGRAHRVAGDSFLVFLPGRTREEATEVAKSLQATRPASDMITLSAIVFTADVALASHLRETIEGFEEQLYRAEVASGRGHSNLVVDEVGITPPSS